MKKTTKSTKAPAPASKSAKVTKAVKKTTKTAAPAEKKSPVKAPAKTAAKAPVASKPVPAVKKVEPVPAVKKAEPTPVVTTITALVDVGFGNTLSLRGEGPGLSWEKGLTLDCIADDKWSITLPESARPIVFKFLLNDTVWCAGDDFTVESGGSVTLSPIF